MATVDRDTTTSKNDLAQAAGSAAAKIEHKANEARDQVAEKAQQVSQDATHRAEQAKSAICSKMGSLADKLRENQPSNPRLASATSAVANRLDSAGNYIQSHDASALTSEIGDLIRRHPIPAIAIGVGFGALLGRALKR